MAFDRTFSARPFFEELHITATSLYLETTRLSLFCCLWDMPAPSEPWLHVSKHQTGKGLEVRLGPVLLSAGRVTTPDYEALLYSASERMANT